MSMLSAQVDELRQMAESVGLEVPQAATLMMEAADTIFSLRDRAQDLQAENAKLRDGLADAPKCETCEAMLDCDECLRADGSHKERRRLSAENAKLRELVRDMWFWGYEDHMSSESQEWQMKHIDGVLDRMRELGVEVDG